MAFNQLNVQSYASGPLTAFNAAGGTWNLFNGSLVALNTKVAGSVTSTAGLVIPIAGPQFNIEWDSLQALVQTQLTTSTIQVATVWQQSPDNVNWANALGTNCAGNVVVAAAGSGSLVNTTYFQSFVGINPSAKYVRLAALNSVVTGGAGDNVVVSYFWRKRWTGA